MRILLIAMLALTGCEVPNVELTSPRKSRSDEVSATPSVKSVFAMVSTPGFHGSTGPNYPGVVRAEPWGDTVTTIPSGTLVWLVGKRIVSEPIGKGAKKWYHIRFYQSGEPIDGWMHADILKTPLWKVSSPEPPIEPDNLE